MKEIIQDQIDTNLSLNLKEISKGLNVHPSYLSRNSQSILKTCLLENISGNCG